MLNEFAIYIECKDTTIFANIGGKIDTNSPIICIYAKKDVPLQRFCKKWQVYPTYDDL